MPNITLLLCRGWGRGSEGKINMPNVTAQTLLLAIRNIINWTLISENRLLLRVALRQTLVVSTITFSLKKYSPWCPQMFSSAPIQTVMKYLLALVTHGTALTKIVLFRSRGGGIQFVSVVVGWDFFFTYSLSSYCMKKVLRIPTAINPAPKF